MKPLIFFPLLAFLLGVFVSIFLFIDWLRHGRRPWFLLLWAVALFLFYWFQVPVVLTNLGVVIVVANFNLFFALTFPITFLSLILIFLGVLEITKTPIGKWVKGALVLWLLSSIIFFVWQFVANEGIIKTYSLPLVGNLVFYLPIRILIIGTLLRWLLKTGTKTILGYLGAIGVIGESVLGIVRNVLILKSVLFYPPEFWYVVLSGLKIFFMLQTFSIFLISFGFLFLHRMYYRSRTAPEGKS